MKRSITSIMGVLVLAGALLLAGEARAEHRARYEVTITNLTRGQVITPPVVASHVAGFDLFTLGAPASPELVALAEDGDFGLLLASLGGQPAVYETVAAAGPILPGTSVTVEISAPGLFRRISAVGMLATSNDAFFSVRDVAVPLLGAVTYEGVAYDAGSENNSESCAFIPGPPCGNPHVRDTTGAEGFVHVHAGIHGGADLVPAQHDWRNPVAQVTIRRVH